MLYTLDASTAVNLVVQFMTFFLVTLPGKFIDSSLNSGALRSIWVNFFGNASVIKGLFIIAMVIGIYRYYTSGNFSKDLAHRGASARGNKF